MGPNRDSYCILILDKLKLFLVVKRGALSSFCPLASHVKMSALSNVSRPRLKC